MKKLILCIVITLSSSITAYAAGLSGTGAIDYIYERTTDGFLGVYKVGGNWANPDGCQDSSKLVLSLATNNPIREELYSALLASKMSGRNIQTYLSGCVNWNGITYPNIVGLYTY